MMHLIAIDGSYSTDLDYWVRFGSEKLEHAIKSIPVVKGLVLSGPLTMDDCQSIRSKKERLEVLDLSHTRLPAQVSIDWFTEGAPRLKKIVWPTQNHEII